MSLFLYLILDTLSLSFPLGTSFDKRFNYHKKFKYLFPAITAIAIPFIIWDIIFTEQGVWGFSQEYLIGLNIANLPAEE